MRKIKNNELILILAQCKYESMFLDKPKFVCKYANRYMYFGNTVFVIMYVCIQQSDIYK